MGHFHSIANKMHLKCTHYIEFSCFEVYYFQYSF